MCGVNIFLAGGERSGGAQSLKCSQCDLVTFDHLPQCPSCNASFRLKRGPTRKHRDPSRPIYLPPAPPPKTDASVELPKPRADEGYRRAAAPRLPNAHTGPSVIRATTLVEPSAVTPSVEPRAVAPWFEPSAVAPWFEPSAVAPWFAPRTVAPPVEPSVVAPPVEPSVVAPPVEPSAVTPPVERRVVAPPVEPRVVAPPVEPRVVAPPVEPRTVAPPVEPSVVAPPVEPSAVASWLEPSTVTPPVEPSVVAPSVEPSAVASWFEPSNVAPPVEPSVVAPSAAPFELEFTPPANLPEVLAPTTATTIPENDAHDNDHPSLGELAAVERRQGLGASANHQTVASTPVPSAPTDVAAPDPHRRDADALRERMMRAGRARRKRRPDLASETVDPVLPGWYEPGIENPVAEPVTKGSTPTR